MSQSKSSPESRRIAWRLLSDAGHNFTDALALLLAWFGFYLQAKPANETKTFGYHRAGVLSAFVNALTLIALAASFFTRVTSGCSIRSPCTRLYAGGGGAGPLLNGGIMWGLRSAQQHDINIRSAFVHMLGDLLGSIGIIAGAPIIRFTGWQQVDPLLSILIGVLIIWTAWDIIKESLNILLEGLPRGLDCNWYYEMRDRGCAGRARPAHLEPGIEHARAELPCADRRPAAFRKRSIGAS